ncbi:rhomboid family intramembrane serine protease [Arthrobacter castelli]|uniref:rhomboid family intramembrane serine protease n=1 Tax=Arthrobacter castelli TaxID=271431 RepID=UPI00047D7C84|nr:rhomboid family intramembrane serine protease [Arthrobacter castelli]
MSYGMQASGPSQEVPVCPRHEDRVSYVRCQRCGRPVCGECQRTASVGVQCVDCVKESSRTAPSHRTVYGGAVRPGKPIVTYSLIGASVAVFILQFVVPGLTQMFGYAPVYTLLEPWRMLTASFLHSQSFFLHIVFNMYILWLIGQSLEPLLGRTRFLALYLISAFGGSVGVLLLSPVTTLVIGASGAVFGLFGALFVVQRQRGGDVRQLVILIAINAVLGFVVANIAWQAHLGGLVAGGLAAAAIAYAPRGKHRTLIQAAGLTGVVLILLALGAARIWI